MHTDRSLTVSQALTGKFTLVSHTCAFSYLTCAYCYVTFDHLKCTWGFQVTFRGEDTPADIVKM